MSGRTVTLMIVLLTAGLFCTAFGFDRKGRLIRGSKEPMVYRNKKFLPLPEGMSLTWKRVETDMPTEPEMYRLRYTLTSKGDAGESNQGFVAYPKAPDRVEELDRSSDRNQTESVEAHIVDELGPECRWKIHQRNGQTRSLRILEMDSLVVPSGEYSGWELRIRDGRLLIVKPDSDAQKNSDWIGTYREFDNLDDGK